MSGSIRKTFLAVLAGIALSLGAGNAAADYILDVQNGNILGDGAYGDVTVTGSGTSATITFTAYSPYLFMDRVGIDLSSGISYTGVTLNSLQTCPTCSGETNYSTGDQVDGFGNFNLVVHLFDGGANAVNSLSFTLTGITGTWTADTLLSQVVAGVINPANGDCTGFASDSGSTLTSGTGTCANPIGETVPIPAAAWLFASGLLGLIAVARRRIAGKIPVAGNLSAVAA